MKASNPSVVPDELCKRERQLMASVMDTSIARGAFSVRFVHKTRCGRLESTVYLRQPEVQNFRSQQQGKSQEEKKENVPTQQSPAPDKTSVDVERSARPASPPLDAPPAKLQKEAESTWTKVVRRKPPAKVDKNVLSARGNGVKKAGKKEATPSPPPAPASPPPSSPDESSLLSGSAYSSIDDDMVPCEDELFPPLPSKPSRRSPSPAAGDVGAGAYYTGNVPAGLPPAGLPAYVYRGKGYPRAGFNSATYGGCEPWVAKGGRGRGGGPSRSG